VTLSNKLSVSEYVRQAVKQMRADATRPQDVKKSRDGLTASTTLVYTVMLGKLTYAASVWLDRYTTAADKHRLEAFIRRVVRAGLFTPSVRYTSSEQW